MLLERVIIDYWTMDDMITTTRYGSRRGHGHHVFFMVQAVDEDSRQIQIIRWFERYCTSISKDLAILYFNFSSLSYTVLQYPFFGDNILAGRMKFWREKI